MHQKNLQKKFGKFFQKSRPTMEKTFAQNHFTMMDWSCDLSTMEKTFAQNHITMMDWSCDLPTMEKTFANGRLLHLQSIFYYGVFINATIRE